MAVVHVNKNNFQAEVLNSEKPVLLDLKQGGAVAAGVFLSGNIILSSFSSIVVAIIRTVWHSRKTRLFLS